ncbi:Protein CBG21303 [Caenorhabditis briggsae]|uniref:Uncharacterized protein n=2 Tax=Caenorhabditis briggsae TaxID=6238 RepID=A0AAE9DE24_CAEBR|nr:Protein CBG21303 [Caenorhabditis briggsae]ULU02418.1 hypothetical protein L3Y34_002188 [Caenorhabditis briggsae]CAP38146.1 Protein CBG21303 [Caenorhabditis briggsae]
MTIDEGAQKPMEAKKHQEYPQYRRPRPPIVEVALATTNKYVVYSSVMKLPEARKKAIHKFHSISYYDFFGVSINRPREKMEKWKRLERNWPEDSIPVSPFDAGTLRILVWKQYLPDPWTHYQEIEKRIPGVQKYPAIKEWLLRRSRGTYTGAFSATKGNNWCRVCGCNLFGYPIDEHQPDQ